MIESILAFFDALPAWIVAVTTLVTAAAGIAALTPSKSDDVIIQKVLNVLNVLALNVGKAKNKE